MEINLQTQIELIEGERLSCCKANAPIKGAGTIILDSQDLHMLCKLAKSNNIEVILYSERMVEQAGYYIDKEEVMEEGSALYELIEKEIDEYNAVSSQLVAEKANSALFYFVAFGKYYIQEITYTNVAAVELPTGEEKLQELLQKYSVEIKQLKETEEENKRKAELERCTLMKEFEEYVRNDYKFIEFDKPGHRRDYAYQVFRSNPDAARFRTLFYYDCDVECKAYHSRQECFYELERIYKAGRKQERKATSSPDDVERSILLKDFLE